MSLYEIGRLIYRLVYDTSSSLREREKGKKDILFLVLVIYLVVVFVTNGLFFFLNEYVRRRIKVRMVISVRVVLRK